MTCFLFMVDNRYKTCLLTRISKQGVTPYPLLKETHNVKETNVVNTTA
jgi:hypothetical protein